MTASGRSAILTYHSIDNSGSVISICPELFARQMQWLRSSGIRVVPLAAIRETPGAVALTFDDGYRNFLTDALPVLQAYGFRATVFAVSGYCGRTNEWSDKGRRIPRLPLMDWEELRRLARQDIEIGAHGAGHVDLSGLEADRVAEEMRRCRVALEQELGTRVQAFAYPYGSSTPAIRAVAREEFAICCGTRLAFVTEDSDPADLPRFDMFYLRRMFWLRHLMDGRGRAYLTGRKLLRDVRALLGKPGSA